MAIVTTDSRHYEDIADAIRAKGVSGSFSPSQMAGAIGQIQAGDSFTPINCLTILHNEDAGYNNRTYFICPFASISRVVVKYKCLDADQTKNIMFFTVKKTTSYDNPFINAPSGSVSGGSLVGFVVNSDNTVDGIRTYDVSFTPPAIYNGYLAIGCWDASWSRNNAYYEVKAYDADNNLVMDLEPCLVNQNDVSMVCFHEKLSDAILWNFLQDTESFVAGEAII